jgi:prevent-host-death family protein
MVKKSVAEAKVEFSALLDRAHRGEEIVVCKSNVPWARIVPLAASEPRRPGAWRGLLSEEAAAGLTAPLPDKEIEAWYK